ncbi:MAG: hypothetical protein E3J36_02090 [Candidatus Nealsonbacteria bacterium]|nr:MAG: hypothetical protein E3J36_02090 [Candidatus Nealsonbacteria bacterium]
MTTKNPKFIINQIRELLLELEGLNIPLASKGKIAPTPFRGLTGEVSNLIQEGFFDQPKDLSEIREKLRAEGIKKNSSELMRPLLQLIKKRFLKRDKIEKKYKYQRR